MKLIKFGRFISCEREKLGVSIEKLAKGLCSVSVLRRIESGERDIDFFLLNRLLERLGISVNKMEILQNRSDYELMIMREYIRDSLIKKEYERVKEILSVYEGKINNSQSLHKQFIYLVRATLASDKEKDTDLSDEYLHKAIELSLPDFDIQKIEQYLLSEEEIVLEKFLSRVTMGATALSSFVALIMIHYGVGLLSIGSLVIMAWLPKLFQKKLSAYILGVQETRGHYTNRMREIIQGFSTFFESNAFHLYLSKSAKEIRKVTENYYQTSLFTSFMRLVYNYNWQK